MRQLGVLDTSFFGIAKAHLCTRDINIAAFRPSTLAGMQGMLSFIAENDFSYLAKHHSGSKLGTTPGRDQVSMGSE